MKHIIPIFLCIGLIISACGGAVNVQQYTESAGTSKSFSLSKEVFIDLPHLGQISDIVPVVPKSWSNPRVLISGNSGTVTLERGVSNVLEYRPPGHKPRALITTSAVTVSGFYSSLPPHAVYNQHGQEQWSFQDRNSITEMVAGDIDGDGVDEFVVGTRPLRPALDQPRGSSGEELILLNSKGKELWRKSYPDIWHVEIADFSGDGRSEILVSNYAGQISILDGSGTSRRSILGYDARHFSLLPWPTKSSTLHLMFSANEHIWIVTPKGELAAKFAASRAHQYEARGVLVKLRAKDPPYLAVVVKVRAAVSSAEFYVFSMGGHVLHYERIPVLFPVLAPMRKDNGTSESLLVGGDGIVWKYDLDN